MVGLFLAFKKEDENLYKAVYVCFKKMNWQRGAGGVVLGRKMHENTGIKELA